MLQPDTAIHGMMSTSLGAIFVVAFAFVTLIPSNTLSVVVFFFFS